MHSREQGEQATEQVGAHPPEQPLVLQMTTAQAAKACGISRPSMARRIKKGHFPGATQDVNGAWSIPVPDLLAAGLNPGKPTAAPAEQAREQGEQATEQVSAHPPEQGEQVMTITVTEYIDLRTRADRYEAIATERGTALEDLRRMTRALEPAESIEAKKKRRWWQKDSSKLVE